MFLFLINTEGGMTFRCVSSNKYIGRDVSCFGKKYFTTEACNAMQMDHSHPS